MEKTVTTAPLREGRFARDLAPTEAAAPPAPAPAPPGPVELRTIQRRWPRTVPEKRVFPRG